MRLPTRFSILLFIVPVFPFTLAQPSHSLPPPPPSPATLSRRASHIRPLTDCSEGRHANEPGGNHANWAFQQSFCTPDDAWQNPRHFRKYRIDCREPNSPSMLQAPVPWTRRAFIVNECGPSEICVDGPYTPPDPALMAQPWYKHHGTAYCVDQQYFVHLGQDRLRALGAAAEEGGGAAGLA